MPNYYATEPKRHLRLQAQQRANKKALRRRIIKETLEIILGAAGLLTFIIILLYGFAK